jgi:hypothetical protein
MSLCPFAVQKPVAAHGGLMSKHIGVVIHVTAGEGDPFNEFANPNNQVSSHFGIGNGQGGMADGQLEQYVDTLYQSWAQVAGNSTYISVETEGEPTDPLTLAQVATFARLYAWIVQQYPGIPMVVVDTPGMPGFITHGDGGPAWGGHTGCPGPQRSAERQGILNLAKQDLGQPQGGNKVNVRLNWKLSAPPADILVWPGTEAAILLTTDGAIWNEPGTPYYEGANGQAYFVGRTAAQLLYRPAVGEPVPAGAAQPVAGYGEGYQIVDTAGERYNYGPK